MRISSNMMFDSNVASMNLQQSRLLQTQQQMSSGNRILNASDDPLAAASVLEVSQQDATNTQYSANRAAARSTLSIADGTLQSVTSLIMDVQSTVISAGHGSLDATARKALANNLTANLQSLLGLANSKDGQGKYLFGGFQSNTAPFAQTAAGIAYMGNDGQQQVQVSANQQLASTDSGADIFMRIRNGNGVFDAKAAAANTGTAGISPGSVTNPALLTGNSYSLTFNVVGGVTTYDVMNTTTGAAVSAGNPYVSGQSISFAGMQTSVSGVPATGDVFTVQPSANESVFTTISDVITALNTPTANLTASLSRGINNLNNALNNVLTTQSSVGVRINQIDTLQTYGDNVGLQFKQILSGLQDTDYTKAAIALSQQNLELQAAHQSFAKVSNLSLFTYL